MSGLDRHRASATRWELGAISDGHGVDFRLRSRGATAIELCLFHDQGRESRRPLERGDDGNWHVRVAGVGPGQRYGYRVDGPYRPSSGDRFNSRKLLIDPWSRAISGTLSWDDSVLGYDPGDPDGGPSDLDSASDMPRSVVADPRFDWQGDRAPETPWHETVIYEAHVRGLTRLHPAVPPALRGTYLGLCEPVVIDHLRSLGVTAVELMPVQTCVSELHLARSGLSNYWGYNPLGWLAPDERFAGGGGPGAVVELKTLVRELHRAGIEVILDIVLNHTCEGDHRGPTLSLRGLDNRAYYRLDPADPSRYRDFTGCGNTLDFSQPEVIDLALAALRSWVREFHVDGFRFDLATTLGRDPEDFDPRAAFFERLARDPLLGKVKRIAEPWDLGPGGYSSGRFPEPWLEWDDRWRDAVRRLWRGEAVAPRTLFDTGPGPRSAVRYIGCHDGFTLADRVAYEAKANWDNGEDNRDGSNSDLSRNWGVEGPTDDPEVLELRARAQRGFLATLAVALGVPMLSHGDELGRSQRGNNNAYCQDNQILWVDWGLDRSQQELLDFSRRAMALRRENAVLSGPQSEIEALILGRDGVERSDDEGATPARSFGVLLRVPGLASLLLLFNSAGSPQAFRLPRQADGEGWVCRLDSASPGAEATRTDPGGDAVVVGAHSLQVFEVPRTP